MKKNKIVLDSSESAASHVKGIEGWVDRHGIYWGKNGEDAARYAGCTHISCSGCGKPTPKSYTACDKCREKKKVMAYKERDKVKWDGKTPLYSEACDKFFFDDFDLDEFMAENHLQVASMGLVICEPIEFREVEDD
jgi:hypothetical protein